MAKSVELKEIKLSQIIIRSEVYVGNQLKPEKEKNAIVQIRFVMKVGKNWNWIQVDKFYDIKECRKWVTYMLKLSDFYIHSNRYNPIDFSEVKWIGLQIGTWNCKI